MPIARQVLQIATLPAVVLIAAGCAGEAQSVVQPSSPQEREFAAALGAHHLCSGLWVVGRDYRRTADEVLGQDIARFPAFGWQDDFVYDVDRENHSVTVSAGDFPARMAKYHGAQGCTILPRGETEVHFTPVDVASALPDAESQPWPTGERDAMGPLPPEVDQAALDGALDYAMEREDQNTRALVVAYKGKIIAERFAPGFTENTPQISWSMGKSITAALFGVVALREGFDVNDPAPVPEWRAADDPRREITIAHLLRMSSGLDFHNYGLGNEDSYTTENEHFRIYFDGLNVFEHAVNQPPDVPPNTQWRYRNSDPLTIGRIVRQTVEARGENYLTFPQRALFDKIGMRNVVLETDAWGNFILTGYDFASAHDWVRFGLLHLWDGVWQGERILPEWWVDFISTPAPADTSQGYGGLWWLNRGGSMSRVPADAFWASGYMGQRTMVIPSRDMVIVRLGPSPGGFGEYMNEVAGRILDAVEPVTAE